MWLGPSLLALGAPLAFGLAVRAARVAADRWAVCLALAVATLEMAGWALVMYLELAAAFS
jgi:hypothetical protein